MKTLIFLSVLFGASLVMAAETPQTHALMTPEEQDLYQKSKKRSYPGGKDEESLKVQSQLPQATRKMGPAQEAVVEEEPTEAAD